MTTLTMRRIKDNFSDRSYIEPLSSRAGVTLRTRARSTTGLAHLRDGADYSAKIPAMPRKRPLRRRASLRQNEKPRRVETGGEAGRGGLKQNGARSSRDGRLLRLTLSDLPPCFG